MRSEARDGRPLVRFVTPAPVGTRLGNRVTALRWARLLRQLGARVALDTGMPRGPADLLVALHACKSAPAVRAFAAAHPGTPVVVALTGTDVYDFLHRTPEECESLSLATRIVALQPRAADELDPALRPRVRAIFQSASPSPRPRRPAEGFVVVLLAHLRGVKDALLPARAVRLLPAASKVKIVHFGGALDVASEQAARAEAAGNPRYEWRGDVPRAEALAALAGSDLLVVPSRLEGGANVVSEAVAAGVPVLSTRIGGSTGLLGEAYPGLYPVGDEAALAALLARVEGEPAFHAELAGWCDRLRPLVDPAREREAWAELLAELGVPCAPSARRTRLAVVATPVESEREALARDVAEGLAAQPRRLSCRFFYDRAGSDLFEQICRLPEYYLTRAEREILEARAPAIAAAMPIGTVLFELGCGNAEKTRLVLDAFCRRQSRTLYEPLDVSREMLEQTARGLLAEEAALEVRAIAAEYEAGLVELGATAAPARLVLWLGSNIGNLDRSGAAAFLGRVRARLGPADRILVGIDLRKDRALLEPAYDDAQGVTARFNANLLARIDRELDADFALDAWAHRARYDEALGRIEMWLVSRRAQTVRIAALGLETTFAEGEAVHTEDSYKYSFEEIDVLARRAGLERLERWTDAACRFALVLFAPTRGD